MSDFKNRRVRIEAQNKRKVKVLTKLTRDIVSAARAGGGDVKNNSALQRILEKARVANMTKDVIERAIKRGTGEIKSADYIERIYEGYAAGGVAVMVRTLTDNPTRTITNVRDAFKKNGGAVGTEGSVAWMFTHGGVIVYPCAVGAEEKIMSAAIDAGAHDVRIENDMARIITSVNDFVHVREMVEPVLGDAEEAELSFVPHQFVPVNDKETAALVMDVVNALNDDDDVQSVITNMQMSDDVAREFDEML